MTIEQMNKVYGTNDTEDFGRVTWLLPVDMTDEEHSTQFLITQPDGLSTWSTSVYHDDYFTGEMIWPTLSHAYAVYELLIKEIV